VPRGDLVMRAEVGDPAVLDNQQPIGVEARRFTLPSDMPPRIVNEVEERSPDAECGHCAPAMLTKVDVPAPMIRSADQRASQVE
jgi:hypothetical protein